jgi:hypothetical protein
MHWHWQWLRTCFFLLLMVRFVCPGHGCQRQFGSSASLSAHKRGCRLKIAATAKLILRRRQALERQQSQHEEDNQQIDEYGFGPMAEDLAESAEEHFDVLLPEVSIMIISHYVL